MRTLLILLRHSWKYALASMMAFFVAWHFYSLFTTVKHLNDKTEGKIRLHAFQIEEAYQRSDLIRLRNVLGQIHSPEKTQLHFQGSDSSQIFLRSVILGAADSSFLSKEYQTDVEVSGATIGTIRYTLDLGYINAKLVSENAILYLTVTFFMLLMTVFANTGALRVLSRLDRGLLAFEKHSRDDEIEDLTIAFKKEFSEKSSDPLTISFLELIKRYGDQVDRVASYRQKLQISQSLSQLATQVSHDIRSPLAALNMILRDVESFPEDQRLIVKTAVDRINEIANDLLERSKAKNETPIEKQVVPLSTLVDALVSEKRMEFRDLTGVEIQADLERSWGAFAEVDAKELKRILSNIINNSVEAFPDGRGTVTVSLKKEGSYISLMVKDNGKGIPPHILEKLGDSELTYGKSGTQSGSGVGVYHAKQTIQKFGGSFEILSTQGEGTLVKIILCAVERSPAV
jgi:signal transduction histidine kinase